MHTEFVHGGSHLLASPLVGSEADSTEGDGVVASILGTIYGMQYNKRGPSTCYESWELALMSLDEILSYFTWEQECSTSTSACSPPYLPENWANMGFASKDLIDFTAAISSNCNTEILLNSLIGLFSE
jgi:hypothetical protein